MRQVDSEKRRKKRHWRGKRKEIFRVMQSIVEKAFSSTFFGSAIYPLQRGLFLSPFTPSPFAYRCPSSSRIFVALEASRFLTLERKTTNTHSPSSRSLSSFPSLSDETSVFASENRRQLHAHAKYNIERFVRLRFLDEKTRYLDGTDRIEERYKFDIRHFQITSKLCLRCIEPCIGIKNDGKEVSSARVSDSLWCLRSERSCFFEYLKM